MQLVQERYGCYNSLKWHLWPGKLAEDIHKSEMNLATLYENGGAVAVKKPLKHGQMVQNYFFVPGPRSMPTLLHYDVYKPSQANIQ